MKIKITVLLIMSLFSSVGYGQSVQSIADEYLSYYTASNFDKLEKMYSDESIFEDPTTSAFSPKGDYQKLKGPQQIIPFLKDGFSNVKNAKYTVKEQYTVGVVQYYSGVLKYNSTYNVDGKSTEMKFELPLNIILEIKDRKVVHHTDIANYNVWSEQYNKQSKG